MGIYLNFAIAPFRISPSEWERTYEDALQIADKCNLLDQIVTERNGIEYVFARKTAERKLYSGLGFHTLGTMDSGCNMEDFSLYRSLQAYRDAMDKDGKQTDNGVDILFDKWYTGDPEDKEMPRPNLVAHIWDGKTQGRPGHMALLTIACLFADRFPHAVMIGGNISVNQCDVAARLVRQCLGIDIQPPVICRPDALAKQIRAENMPEHLQLTSFFDLYLGGLTEKVGTILKDVFGEDALYRYFRDKIAEYHKKGYSYSRDIGAYLLLGLDFADLLRLMVSDEQGCRVSLETMLEKLFSYNTYARVSIPSTAEDKNNETPRIEFLLMVVGGNIYKRSSTYISLRKIREVCQSFDSNSDAIIDRLLQKQTPKELSELVSGWWETEENHYDHYDICTASDLFRYAPGCTFEPKFEESLLKYFRLVQALDADEMFRNFLKLDRVERERWFLRKSCRVLLRETMWNHIFESVMNDQYIRRYFLFFLADCSSQYAHELLEALLTSPELVNMLWAKSLNQSAVVVDEQIKTQMEYIRNLAKNMQWTIEKAMEILEIPEDERQQYKDLLAQETPKA